MIKYLCVTDLEATCWDNGNVGKRHEMETIEIGSVLINAETLQKVSEFQNFIKPVRNPVLSDFCKSLTTITQDQVNGAESFPVVFTKWLNWMNQVDTPVLASWGRYDYNQLLQDCTFHSIAFPFTDHVNIKNVVAEKMRWRPQGVSKALARLGFKFEGTAHRGIDDARNIHRIIKKVYGGSEGKGIQLT